MNDGVTFVGTFAITVLVSFLFFPRVIRRLKKTGMVGRDMNKAGRPEVAEMGGLVITAAFSLGVLLMIGLRNFDIVSPFTINTDILMAALSSVLIIAFIGVFDDLISVRKHVKMLMPVVASLPLVAVKAGITVVTLPWLGEVDFGIVYPLVIVPIGMTGAANAANILGGFNGLEAGLGLIATTALSIITLTTGQLTPFLILLCAIGPLAVTLVYNWYPARVFVGDVGTLSIGAILCCACVLGNCETAGVIVMFPYALDAIVKIRNGLPSKGWWGELRDDGKLHCPETGPVGLCQTIMKMTGGITERKLVVSLLVLEAVCAGVAVALYAKF